MDSRDKAAFVLDRKNRSLLWLEANFFDEWEQVWKNYKCERDPEVDEEGKPDPSQSSVGMPDTWSHVRRLVARGTAQPPNVRFRANDPVIQKLVSRTIMYQWDKARVQKQQKRHFTQAALFGWSVRAWFWDIRQFHRTRRIDPMDQNLDPVTLQAISDRYRVPLRFLTHPDPEIQMAVRSSLLAKHSRGGLLPISYKYTAYEGPACEFIFIGDCYPQPNFQSLQDSNWFIVERRRNLTYFEQLAQLYPQLKKGLQDLQDKFPHGNRQTSANNDTTKLRERMQSAIDRTNDDSNYLAEDKVSGLDWTITEMHTPGPNGKITYTAGEGGDGVYIGEIPQPYDIDGRIPFTELRLIDDLLCGIGDSTARIMRGLQAMHDRLANRKSDLVDSIARPFWATDDRALYEQPQLVKKFQGNRLLHLRNQNGLRQIGEPASQAAVVQSLNEEQSIGRMIQMATGDSNMSQNANVDPAQGRTATGARIMAYNQDILTKDMNDQFTQYSLVDDAEMMYLLNRSELSEPLTFDANQYDREYASDRDMLQEQFITAEPKHFQVDGEILVEAGSTLADDDDANVQKAEKLYAAAMQDPGINRNKAREELLISYGKGRELPQWIAPPPPPPQPELKASASVAIKPELLGPELGVQATLAILKDMGIDLQPPPPPVPPQGGMPPGAPLDQASVGGPPATQPQGPPPDEDQLIAAQAYEAARGHSPFNEQQQQQ